MLLKRQKFTLMVNSFFFKTSFWSFYCLECTSVQSKIYTDWFNYDRFSCKISWNSYVCIVYSVLQWCQTVLCLWCWATFPALSACQATFSLKSASHVWVLPARRGQTGHWDGREVLQEKIIEPSLYHTSCCHITSHHITSHHTVSRMNLIEARKI